MQSKKSVAVLNLGCKANAFDGAAILHAVDKDRVLQRAKSAEDADIVVINSCSVTDRSTRETRQLANRIKRHHPTTKVVVTGCYAQSETAAVASQKSVDLVVGNADKPGLVQLLSSPQKTNRKVVVSPARRQRVIFYEHIQSFGDRTRTFLKVQDGCNNFCTFCIIPKTRGLSCSLSWQTIREQLDTFVKNQYKEVVITGIDLGSYGYDLKPRSSLQNMLGQLATYAPPLRIRLSSLDPEDFTPEILGLLGAHEIFAKHMHLPLQSGDNAILKSMRRSYNVEDFCHAVSQLKAHLPDCGIGTDIITGFPGESEASFQRTKALVERLPLSYLHVFPFSPKKGTPAAELPERPSALTARRRCQILREIGANKKRLFLKQHIGKHLNVLIESKTEGNEEFAVGYSSNYIPCLVPKDKNRTNEFVTVVGERLNGDSLECRIV